MLPKRSFQLRSRKHFYA